jgi:hypothetical protein
VQTRNPRGLTSIIRQEYQSRSLGLCSLWEQFSSQMALGEGCTGNFRHVVLKAYHAYRQRSRSVFVGVALVPASMFISPATLSSSRQTKTKSQQQETEQIDSNTVQVLQFTILRLWPRFGS